MTLYTNTNYKYNKKTIQDCKFGKEVQWQNFIGGLYGSPYKPPIKNETTEVKPIPATSREINLGIIQSKEICITL